MNSALSVMWHRQIKEFFRNKHRLITTLVQPVLFLIAFGFGLGNSFENTSGINYIQYLLPGIVAMTIMMNSTMAGMSLIWDKKFGFLKETLVAPVSRTGLLFGRCLGVATTSIFQGIIVLVLGYAIMGYRLTSLALLPIIILAMFAVALLFSLLGTALATKFDDMQSFPSIMNFLMMPMMFLSSAFFETTSYPAVLQFIVKINPFNYCAQLLRYLMSNMQANITLSLTVITSLIILLGFLGTIAFNKMEA